MNETPSPTERSPDEPASPSAAPLGLPARRSERGRPGRSTPQVWMLLGALGAVAAAGGGTPLWARALVMLGIGAWLCARPPRETPARTFDWAVLVLGIAALTAFLPAGWFGTPNWRANALDFGIALPGTLAPSPWLAGESWAQLLAGLGWLYLCWNIGFDHETRSRTMWGLAALASLLALGVIAGQMLGVKYPLGREATVFSYFPNRNQTALWFALGGLVSFGLLLEALRSQRQSRRRPRSIGWLLAGWLMLMLCLLALVMSLSRMALLLFALGSVALVVMRFGVDAGGWVVRILVPLMLLLASLMVFFGRDTLGRMHLFGGGGGQDFRVELWRDTLDMAAAQPAGAGLGQFEDVFPQYRELSRSFQSVRHPDSDWFWLLGETGWLGIAAAVAAVAALAALLAGREARASGPLRQLAALCLAVFLLHSLVDVPAHRFGTWLLAGLFLALARPERPPAACLFPAWMFRACGGFVALAGAAWLAASAGAPTFSSVALERADNRASRAFAEGDAGGVRAAAATAIAVRPMRWPAYYQLGRSDLFLLNDPGNALAEFQRARFLDPIWSGVPYAEGILWSSRDTALAVAAWREALTREDDVPDGLWVDILRRLARMPGGGEHVSNLSKIRPVYREYFLRTVGPEQFPNELRYDIARDPKLRDFTPKQRQHLLERWAALEGAAALEYLGQQSRVPPDPLMVQLIALAATGHAQEAMTLVQERLSPMSVPEFSSYARNTDAELGRLLQVRLQIQAGATLVGRQLAAGQDADALETLNLLAKLNPQPPFVSWWRAELLARTGRHAEAWEALQPYLNYQRAVKDTPAPALSSQASPVSPSNSNVPARLQQLRR